MIMLKEGTILNEESIANLGMITAITKYEGASSLDDPHSKRKLFWHFKVHDKEYRLVKDFNYDNSHDAEIDRALIVDAMKRSKEEHIEEPGPGVKTYWEVKTKTSVTPDPPGSKGGAPPEYVKTRKVTYESIEEMGGLIDMYPVSPIHRENILDFAFLVEDGSVNYYGETLKTFYQIDIIEISQVTKKVVNPKGIGL